FLLIDQGVHKITFFNQLDGLVQADRKLFRQILANLLTNAMKYSPAGTEITIYLGEDNGRIHLEVRDQGMGIPESSLPHLFEAYHRANNVKHIKGNGLG